MTPATAAPPDVELEPIPETDSLYEVVNGQIVEPPPMGTYGSLIATMLDQTLGPFARTHNLGRVASETLFVLDRGAKLRRRPDVAFVSYERWPRDRRIADLAAWDVVPDLAIEVVSPSDQAYEALEKLHEYFRAGVRQVWLAYPRWAEVYVYESPTSVRILARADELDGGALVPGFRLPLASLFEDEDGPA